MSIPNETPMKRRPTQFTQLFYERSFGCLAACRAIAIPKLYLKP